MKNLAQNSTLLMALAIVIAVIGCDTATDVANSAKDAAGDAAEKAKDAVTDMANIDFGDFDMSGMKEKLTGITDGFKDVTADNVDGLTSKISEFTGSLDGMGIDKLTGAAKTAVTGALTKFTEGITAAMEGISDEGILGKLKPIIDALMEKINAFK